MDYIATHDPPDSFVTAPNINASLSAKPTRIENPKMTVVALGGFGGRVDQSFHSVSIRVSGSRHGGMLMAITGSRSLCRSAGPWTAPSDLSSQ